MSRNQRDELEQLANRAHQMMNKLWQWHVGDFLPDESWTPQVNVYQFERRLEVCVDLAGLEPSKIDVHIEPGRLIIRGVRPAPDPRRSPDEPMRLDAMEIDHGAFSRVLRVPDQVDLARVESQYLGGFLWIRMPFRDPG